MKKLREFLAMILSVALIVGIINVKAYAKENDDLNSLISNITLGNTVILEGDKYESGPEEYRYRFDPSSLEIELSTGEVFKNDGPYGNIWDVQEQFRHAMIDKYPEVNFSFVCEDIYDGKTDLDVGEYNVNYYVYADDEIIATGQYSFEIVENDIEAVRLEDKTLVEGKTQERWDDKLNQSYNVYDVSPSGVTIETSSHGIYSGNFYDTIDEFQKDYGLTSVSRDVYDDYQSVDQSLGLGDYYFHVLFAGQSYEYSASIINNPITSIQISDKVYLEGEYETRDEYFVNDESIKYDWYAYNTWPEYIKVTAGNVTYEGNYDEVSDKIKKDYPYMDTGFWNDDGNQEVDKLWGAGQHTVKFKFLELEGTYEIVIKANPIDHIVVQDFEILEGNTRTEKEYWDNDERIELDWERYNVEPEKIDVYLKDDTVISGNVWDVRDRLEDIYKLKFDTGFDDDQTPTNIWEAGTEHAVRLFMGPVSCGYKVKILESPIANVVVNDKTIIEGDVHKEYEYWVDGERYEYEWEKYNVDPGEIIVTLKNGTQIAGNAWDLGQQLSDQFGVKFDVYTSDDQTPSNIWEAGKTYTVTLKFGSVSCNYSVSIIQSPLKNVTILGDVYMLDDDYEVITEYNGDKEITYKKYNYWPEEIEVELVNAVNGKSKISGRTDDVIDELASIYGCDRRDISAYTIDGQADGESFEMGENTVSFKILGKSAEFKVVIIKNIIDKLTVGDGYCDIKDKTVLYSYFDKDEKEVFEQFEGYFVMPEKAKIFYTDNTSFEGNLQEVYDDLIAKYNITNGFLHINNRVVTNQRPDNSWDKAGSYDAVFYFGNFAYPFNIIIYDGIRPDAFMIISSPSDTRAFEGDYANFSVEAQGENISYQWMLSKDGGKNWTNSSATGSKSKTVKVLAKESNSGYLYKCVVKSGNETLETEPVILIVNSNIASSVSSYETCAGDTVKFKVKLNSPNNASYQWQISKDNGKSWKDSGATGNKTNVLQITTRFDLDGTQYRCKITKNGYTIISDAGVLIINPKITSEPGSASAYYGETATFKVTARGTNLKYQWQVSSDNGKNWSNSSSTGNKTSTLKVIAKSTNNGKKFRCVITDGVNMMTSRTVTITSMNNIISQPISKTAKSGAKAIFTVKAKGSKLSYQWQISKDNGKTWKNSGATGNKTATLTVKAEKRLNGTKYRCVVTNGTVKINSNVAILTVK